MQKKRLMIVVFLVMSLLLVMPLVSASILDWPIWDWLGITGKVGENETNVTELSQCDEGAIPSSGCKCQDIDKYSGYCCYSYLVDKLMWTTVPCTQTCTSIGGVCCSGAASDCVGTWSGQWATDCQGYTCCLGTCTGTCYGVGCPEEITCTDSDGGVDYYTKGTVTLDNGTSETDWCFDDTLIEWECMKSDSIVWPQQTEYDCTSEGKVCRDGKCIEVIVPNVTCVDSDGGKDYYVRGTAGIPCAPGEPCPTCASVCAPGEPCPTCLPPTDWCTDEFILNEFYCENENLLFEEYTCPYGCSNGACLRVPLTCIDTDGGKNYYTAGSVSAGEVLPIPDVCIDKFTLEEGYCENGNMLFEKYKCLYGCSNGACIKEDMDSCLDNPSNYWDQETDRCYGGYTDDLRKNLCLDPDNGINIYQYAHTFGFRSYYADERDKRIRTGGSDACLPDRKIVEHYCDENGFIQTTHIECPSGCSNGACIETQVEVCAARISISFDKNVYYVGEEFKVVMETFDAQGNHLPHYPFYIQVYDYERGVWKEIGQDRTDGGGYRIHQDKMNVDEPLRFGKNKIKVITKVSGCNLVEDIAIIEIKRKEGPKPVPCGMGSCVPEPEPIDVEPIDIPDERGFYSCSGCEVEGKCYPIGYRKKGKYCGIDNEFIGQRGAGECDNNFECKANICIGGKCLSENLIQRIIEWLKAFFGMKPKPPIEKVCSKLLLEHNIGEYKYVKSMHGEVHGEDEYIKEQTQAPLFSKDGKHLGTIKCCAAIYKDKEDTEHGVLFCPYDSKEDVTNSVKWLIAKERFIVFKEYEDEKVFGDDKGQLIAWINNAYLIAVGVGPLDKRYLPLPEDIANAYLKKYPSEFELTEDDIPDAPPQRPWVYCTEEDRKKGYKCESQPGARLQTDPNPEDKSCEIYVGCVLPGERCESIDDIAERNNCYVGVAEMTGDVSVCEKITDAERKNKCYVKAAETSKDIGICEKITDENIKRMCLELMADIVPWIICKSEEDMSKEECHFIDDFESGLENWDFHGDEGYASTVVIDGNTVLKLTGVIQPDLPREWDNYLFKFRFKRIEGSVHVNFRKTSPRGGQRRYIVSISKGVNNLVKHVNENWPRLDDTYFRFDENWHTLEIRGYDNILNVYLDDELIYKYKDTENPLLSGMPGFEIHTGGRPITPEFLIDDVEIKLITEQDIIYP